MYRDIDIDRKGKEKLLQHDHESKTAIVPPCLQEMWQMFQRVHCL